MGWSMFFQMAGVAMFLLSCFSDNEKMVAASRYVSIYALLLAIVYAIRAMN